jgi:hypothetical protein
VGAMPSAVGMRVKSGVAIVVLLGKTADGPRLVDRRRIELCDPDIPASRQPYHAGFGTEQTDTAAIARLTKIVERSARRSVARLIGDYRASGFEPRHAGLVVGSDIDPARITNPHIRAHASEGQLFRRVTEEALRDAGVSSAVWIEKVLAAKASAVLGRSEDHLKRATKDLGRGVEGGWRTDDKAAALAAWLALEVRRGTKL